MSQPVRADSPIDEHGEALAGHAVRDLYKEAARVHASILAFVHAELPDHLVPCVIGKTLFQDREGQKGRWPGIVPPALQGRNDCELLGRRVTQKPSLGKEIMVRCCWFGSDNPHL